MAGPCRCCCPQIPRVNNSAFTTTIKVSPDGLPVWRFDSGLSSNIGHLNGDRYFAMGSLFSGSTYQRGRLTVLDLDGGVVLDDDALLSSSVISCSGGGNVSVGSVALPSGGVAFYGAKDDSATGWRLSFFDADGIVTGVNNSPGDSDIAVVGDNVCMRAGGVSAGSYLWIAPDGSSAGSEAASGSGGDCIGAGNIVSFGSTVLLAGFFDVNASGTYQSAIDHRYRIYGDSGAPETSGAIRTTGDLTWGTRYGSNSYALYVAQGNITKVTSGLTITRNTITGVGELFNTWRDVKEDSSGNAIILSNANVYSYPQGGGSANWSVALTNYRRLEVDASGNVYVCGGDLKKYNSSGTLQWTLDTPNIAFSGHVPADDVGIYRYTSLHIDADGYLYVTGSRLG